MDFFSTILVFPIVILCLLTGYVIKHVVSDETIENRWIPVIVTLEGVVVGFILCLCGGEPITAELILNGIIGGGVSGAASTGFQSIFAAFISKAGNLIDNSVDSSADDIVTTVEGDHFKTKDAE